MKFKSVIFSTLAIIPSHSFAYSEIYPAQDYNSGYYIQNVDIAKRGPVPTMEPEQPIAPQIPQDHVLVGIGLRSGKRTVTTVRLDHREIYGGGLFGPVQSSYFGSKPNHVLECEWSHTAKIAITGIALRINGKDDFRFLQVNYRNFDTNGNLLPDVVTETGYDYYDNRNCNNAGTHIEAQYFPEGDKIITGIGVVNHDEDVDSMWIYRGDYLNH